MELASIILNDGFEHDLRTGIPKLWHLAALHVPGVTQAMEAKLHLPITDVYEYFRENYGRKHYIEGQYDFNNPDDSRYDVKPCLKNAIRDHNDDAIVQLNSADGPNPIHNAAFFERTLPNPSWVYYNQRYMLERQIGYLIYKYYGLASQHIEECSSEFKAKVARLAGLRNDRETWVRYLQSECHNDYLKGLARGGHVDELKMEIHSKPRPINLSIIAKSAGRGGHVRIIELIEPNSETWKEIFKMAIKYGSLVLARAMIPDKTVYLDIMPGNGRAYMFNLLRRIGDTRWWCLNGIPNVSIDHTSLALCVKSYNLRVPTLSRRKVNATPKQGSSSQDSGLTVAERMIERYLSNSRPSIQPFHQHHSNYDIVDGVIISRDTARHFHPVLHPD